MKRPTLTKKRLVIITSFVAILGLTFSVFAETAGGVTIHDTNAADHSTTASSATAKQSAGGAALDTTGLGASLAAAAYTTTSATAATTAGDPATNPAASVSSSQSPSSTPAVPPATTTIPVAPEPSQPPVHCAQCPVEAGHGAMTACPAYCFVTPTPTPGCRPCGGFDRSQMSNAVMCPMYCME